MVSRIPARPELRRSLSPRATVALTLVALAAVWATVLVESLLWVWGVIFSVWALIGILSGETFLVTRLRREDQPVLFWLVSLSWLAIGILWIIYPS